MTRQVKNPSSSHEETDQVDTVDRRIKTRRDTHKDKRARVGGRVKDKDKDTMKYATKKRRQDRSNEGGRRLREGVSDQRQRRNTNTHKHACMPKRREELDSV